MLLIVFDTNAWLNLYTINPIALKEFINKFDKKMDWFWIPEQVYWEFNNHSKAKREGAINAINRTSGNISKQLNEVKTAVINDLRPLKNNCILEDDTLATSIDTQINNIVNTVKSNISSLNVDYMKKMDVISEKNDIVCKLVESIYKNNPPYRYTAVQRINLYEEGELRIKYHIPPGLTDTSKKDSSDESTYRRRYGDFLIWKDVLRKAEESIILLPSTDSLEVIFVEDEKKGDWWIERGNPVISPILKEEFSSVTNNRATIKMVSFSDFLSEYGKEFNINEATVSKVVEKYKYKETVITYLRAAAKSVVEHALADYFKSSTHLFETLFPTASIADQIIEADDYTVSVLDENQITMHETDDGAYYVGNLDFDISATIAAETEGNGRKADLFESNITAKICINIIIDYSKDYSSNHYDVGTILFGIEPPKLRFHEIRKAVFSRDNYTCQICGKTFEDDTNLIADHIIPRRLGGTDELSNLITLCTQCNTRKSNKALYSYTTCPDCGNPINHWNDAGDGFCIECSQKH